MAAFLGPVNRNEGTETYMFAVEALDQLGVLIGDMGIHDMHNDPNECSKERRG